MPDGAAPGRQLPQWIGSLATIAAPASLLSALLFYFGYVSSRAHYEYFGVDVDTIGLDTQDYVMRSPQPLLLPLLVLALLGAGLLALHASVRRRIVAALAAAGDGEGDAEPASGPAGRVHAARRLARVAMTAGLTVLGAGIVLLFAFTFVRGWALYAFVTPMLLVIGAGLVAYASRILDLLRTAAPAPADGSAPPRRAAGVLVYILIAAGIFWTTATTAQWSGRGLAQDQARNLDRLPRVILDTTERLFLRDPVVQETLLPAADGERFHYRYRRLRLLIMGSDRMFLVPERWTASNSTLVVPLDGSVRVQFQFQNRAP